MRRLPLILVAVAAGLALADASIVALALPPILDALDTTVTGVAAVIGVYTLVLALGLLPAAALARRIGPGRAGAAGLLLLALASIGCAAAPSLGVLLLFRGLQALGGAAGLVAAFDLMDAGGPGASLGRRLWVAAAVFGFAAGPAIGGVLTQALDWRAIFAAQAPVALAAAAACRGLRIPPPAAAPSGPLRRRPAVALALVSAALTAVLFLLVLELVAGWSVEPLAAALAVSVLPVVALAGARLRAGDPRVRAAAGALLIAAGAASLAFLPGPDLGWTVAPQVLAGAGMGLALPALAGELLPERTAGDAARLLTARHAGIVAALVLLAPVVTHELSHATEQARLQGVAVVLDARLPPQDKLDLAPALLAGVGSRDPRGGLQDAIDARRPAYQGAERATFDALSRRADDVLVRAVGDAFRTAFLLTGALALLAAAVLVVGERLPLGALIAAAALGVAALTGAVALDRAQRPAAVALRDPCEPRPLPRTGGIAGALQDSALVLLDRAACHDGATREELVLALADGAQARRFEERHGVDPRSARGILQGLFG